MKLGQVENVYFGVLNSVSEWNPNKRQIFKDVFFQIYPTFAHLHGLIPPDWVPFNDPNLNSVGFVRIERWATRLPVDEEEIRCQPQYLRRWLCHETRWFHKKRSFLRSTGVETPEIWTINQYGKREKSNNLKEWKDMKDINWYWNSWVLSDDSTDTPFLSTVNSLHRGCWQVDSCWCVSQLVHLGTSWPS